MIVLHLDWKKMIYTLECC